jgi:hypothetical protein
MCSQNISKRIGQFLNDFFKLKYRRGWLLSENKNKREYLLDENYKYGYSFPIRDCDKFNFPIQNENEGVVLLNPQVFVRQFFCSDQSDRVVSLRIRLFSFLSLFKAKVDACTLLSSVCKNKIVV